MMSRQWLAVSGKWLVSCYQPLTAFAINCLPLTTNRLPLNILTTYHLLLIT